MPQFATTTRQSFEANVAALRDVSWDSAEVGPADVFVSWFLAVPIATLLDALEVFLQQNKLPASTRFWVCDFSIRQTDVKSVKEDLEWLGKCIEAIGHTVLLLQPWDAPLPLKRAYCVKEVYHTQASGARFDLMMSSAQQRAFETALVDNFDSIKASLSRVDVRTCECRNKEDTKAILAELEKDVGFVECNKLVVGLLNGALAEQGRLALGRLPAAERGTSKLIFFLALLLKVMRVRITDEH